MCGIGGIVDKSGKTPDIGTVQMMQNSIRHRGPDDFGLYISNGISLFHNRLSILDLSRNGHQPLWNKRETLCIIYNGEIYNYKELYKELINLGYEFKSHTDTEVVLYAYEQWGMNCIQKFNGMFAFAIWDCNLKELICVRDRLGIKPLYYYFNGNKFVFASEIKAILSVPWINKIPNDVTATQYLIHGHTYDDSTWYVNIHSLSPGSFLRLSYDKLTITKYWDIHYNIDYKRSLNSFTDELKALLHESIKLQLSSDVEICAYLSGGIDSSSIVAISNININTLNTFSASYKEGSNYDESKYIDIVAKIFNTIHHNVIPTAVDVPLILEKLIWHLDEPTNGAAILPMFRVSERIQQQNIKVVLGGQGADEAFGGYPPYYISAVRNTIASLKNCNYYAPLSELMYLPYNLYKGGIIKRYINNSRNINKTLWINLHKECNEHINSCISNLDISKLDISNFEYNSYLDIKYSLRGLLQQEDRMSMACSVESRVPFLDHRIIELSARIPSWYKIHRGISKYILRKSVRGVTPNQILDRTDKKGYPVPIAKWFRSELKEYLYNTLFNNEFYSAKIINRDELLKIYYSHIEGYDNSQILWRALNAQIWYKNIYK